MERIVYLVAYTYKPVKTDKTKKGKSKVIDCFRDELELIKNDDINNFVMEVLRLAPGYFFSIPSSSTGKYHPKYEYCTGGLTIHTRAVVYFLTNLLELDMFRKEFTIRERELLIAAAILHDVKKNGENPQSKYTVFEHPRLASEFIVSFKGCGIIPDEEIQYIADCVITHMGQWNTKKRGGNDTLPLPTTLQQKLIHLSDYLSSREDVNLEQYLFTNKKKPELKGTILNFGKYKGSSIKEIRKTDPEYLNWCYTEHQQSKKNGGRGFLTKDIELGIKEALFSKEAIENL